MPYADVVLQDGPIITMDAKKRIVNSVAVKDGYIIAVGSKPEVKRLIGPTTQVVDLDGRTVMPGLVNTHDHFLEHGISSAYVIDIRYPKTKSIKDIKRLIAQQVETAKKGQWIIGHTWDETLLEEKRFPNRYDLDEVSPDNPVYIKRVFQMGVANSEALELSGITKDTHDPEFGIIDRDKDGEPTGLLRGRATELITDKIKWSHEEKVQALKQACRDFNSVGFTTVIEPGIMSEGIEAYRDIAGRGELSIRVLIQVGFLHDVEETRWAVNTYTVGGDDNLRIIGLKIALDGGVGPRTALFYEGYLDNPDVHGVQMIPDDELNEMVHIGHVNGFQVAIHAIGDKAIDIAMNAYEYAVNRSPRPDPRHQIVHNYFPSETALRKIKDLGVMVNTQTPFIYFLGDSFLEALGPERCSECMPVKTLNDRGIPVGISHDATVTQPLPNIGLYASVTRRTIKGEVMGTKETVTPLQALSFYTVPASKHCFMEDKIGSIEVGKYGDLAVWNFNPLEVDPEMLKEWQCQMTYLGGRLVYEK